MNRNPFDLQLSSRSRSKGFKSGACGICLAHRFYLETAWSTESKALDCRFEPLKKSLWRRVSVRACVIPNQTDSLQSTVFRYSPL
jgi:hypothetical protein